MKCINLAISAAYKWGISQALYYKNQHYQYASCDVQEQKLILGCGVFAFDCGLVKGI